MNEPGGAVLRVCGVHKSFAAASGTTVALNGVDLDIEPRSFVSIVGPSGCGKSTLLQIMAGLPAPTPGGRFFGTNPPAAPPPGAGFWFPPENPPPVSWEAGGGH